MKSQEDNLERYQRTHSHIQVSGRSYLPGCLLTTFAAPTVRECRGYTRRVRPRRDGPPTGAPLQGSHRCIRGRRRRSRSSDVRSWFCVGSGDGESHQRRATIPNTSGSDRPRQGTEYHGRGSRRWSYQCCIWHCRWQGKSGKLDALG